MLDALTEMVRRGVPWDIMHADDVVLVGESKQELEERTKEWRISLENRRMRISKSKTEYLMMIDYVQDRNRDENSSTLDGEPLNSVTDFIYIGSSVTADEKEERIQARWKNLCHMSGVLCDKTMPINLREKVYKTVVRQAMMYGLKNVPMKKSNKKKMEVEEPKMMSRMSEVTMKNITKYVIRNTVKLNKCEQDGVRGAVQKIRPCCEERRGEL